MRVSYGRRFIKAKGLRQASPGQRPGFDEKKEEALKGRDNPRNASTLVSPFQGFNPVGMGYPGRCPGLACYAPLGRACFAPLGLDDRRCDRSRNETGRDGFQNDM